jgi:hypothetical protein
VSIEASGRPPGNVGDEVVAEGEGFKIIGVIRTIIRIGKRWLVTFRSGEAVEYDDGRGRIVSTERRRRNRR